MTEATSIPRRISRIKKLAREYYALPPKALIDKHVELLRVFDIRGSKHAKHPHKMHKVYISRMALKHFVEQRKAELTRKHTGEEALEHIYFAIEKIQDVITDFDKYEYEPEGEKHFYSKAYSSVGKPPIRILVEQKRAVLEVRSFHFRKL